MIFLSIGHAMEQNQILQVTSSKGKACRVWVAPPYGWSGTPLKGECRQLEFWVGKGANIRDLFCTSPKVLKLHGNYFPNIKKYWAKEVPEG